MNSDAVSTLVNRARQLLGLAEGSPVDRILIERVVVADAPTVTAMTGLVFTPDQIVEAVRRLETIYVVEQGRALVLKDQKRPTPWYVGARRQPGDFMSRYLQKLAEDDWPRDSLTELQESTARVLELLDDPQREGPWDWRGLVVGDVQSGKTAHYAGVINRAADAGYRVIIVLAGMHDVLRLQTQRRLDQDFLGYDTAPRPKGEGGGRKAIGVGKIDPRLIVDSLTTTQAKGDFSQTVADQANFAPLTQPCLLVVKKNARILQNLNRWIGRLPDKSRAAPLLVIDDEADQASVDTGDQPLLPNGTFDADYDPKRINGEIRKLLASFGRAAYLGYTATPFANILIHDARSADGYGPDLFPSTFIVSLTPPDDYFGPVAVFGTKDDDSSGLPLIRYIDQTREGWIPDRHDKTLRPRFGAHEVIPPSLETAVDAFILACAARSARGEANSHNSMLIHVSRFVDVHDAVHAQVDYYLRTARAMIVGGDQRTLIRLEELWITDFEPTTAEVIKTVFGRQTIRIAWNQVLAELADAAEKIEVVIANGSRKNDIDYDSYKESGRSLIAVGGDKLSRGLTLEGLSISYFLRISKQYDSLLQMGRWFGYRRRFADLCRLYTTADMEDWFQHVATATRNLRLQFAHMQITDATPADYGLRVESHPILTVTATNKQRHATERASGYAGEGKIQTVFFRDPDIVKANAEAVDVLLLSLSNGNDNPLRPGGKGTARGTLWTAAPGASVADFLASLRFPPENIDVEGAALAAYIASQIADHGELTNWTVFLASAGGTDVAIANRQHGTIKRAPRTGRQTPTRYVIGTILSPEDEAIDLSDHEYARALEDTNRGRAEEGESPTDRPSGPDIRRIRGERPTDALLIIYPLDPKVAEIESKHAVIGVMVSFPESNKATTKVYVENVVRSRELEA